MSLVTELADRAHRIGAEEPPPTVSAAARAHLTDSVAALVAGHRTLHASMRPFAGGGDARAAAFAGGAYTHCWELTGVHQEAVLCPGSVVLPVVLATLAEDPGLPWDRVVRAYLAGYDVALAAAVAVGSPQLIKEGWWPTALVGPLGAAAAASLLRGHPVATTASAIALAAQQAGGVVAGTTADADGRHLLSAFAAERAVVAVQAAEAGWRGPLDVLDDARSPLRGGTPPAGYLLPRTSMKQHAAAKHLQTAIAAVLAMREAAGGWRPADVHGIRCALPEQLVGVVDRPPPLGSPLQALASAQFVLAVAALRGHCLPDDLGQDALRDPDLHGVARRVVVEPAADLSAAFPARWGARVEIVTSAGIHREEVHQAAGDPGRELSGDQLVAKFVALAGPTFGVDRAGELCRSLLTTVDGPPPPLLVEDVLPLLTRSARLIRSDPIRPMSEG